MANLLTLPREIRDRIYTYLTRDLTVQWHRGIDDWKSTLETTFDIEIKDAPLLNVLLTHSRLRDEYLESTVFKRFSIMLRFAARGMFDKPEAKYVLGSGAAMTTAGLGLLRRISHMTAFVDCGEDWRFYVFPGGPLYADLRTILEILTTTTTNLESIKVAFKFRRRERLHHTNTTPLRFSSGMWGPTPPPSICGLPHVHRVDAYQLSHTRPTFPMPGHYVANEVTEIACEAFQKKTKCTRCWSQEEILTVWPNTKLAAPDPAREIEEGAVDGLPYTFGGWRERTFYGETESQSRPGTST
jgi:hypothetical protein